MKYFIKFMIIIYYHKINIYKRTSYKIVDIGRKTCHGCTGTAVSSVRFFYFMTLQFQLKIRAAEVERH